MSRLSREDLDHILCLQLTLAWAGETPEEEGEDMRLGWWKTDLLHEDAGMALFRQLTPRTAAWAALCSAREAARRTDARIRQDASDASGFLSIFSLGFEIDEQLDERIAELRRSGQSPARALPGLFPQELPLNRAALSEWLGRAAVRFEHSPSGRRLSGAPPEGQAAVIDHLASAIRTLPSPWMAPHFRLRP
jgi:hypothetical protein